MNYVNCNQQQRKEHNIIEHKGAYDGEVDEH